MFSGSQEPTPSKNAKVILAVAELAIIAAALLIAPLILDMGQTTEMFGVAVPTVIVAIVFWVLGVVGGGVFSFRWR